jgi:hypothetical protein
VLYGMQGKLGPVLQRGDSFKGAAAAGGVWQIKRARLAFF